MKKNRNNQSKRVAFPKFHNLYIISVECGKYFKFGYSSDINKRVRTYTKANPFAEVLTFYRTDAVDFELWYHSAFTAKVMDEWYTAEDMANLITLIHNTPPNAFGETKQGHSVPQTVTHHTGCFTNTGKVKTMIINNYMTPNANALPPLPKR